MRSWLAPRARWYREALNILGDWGTAIIVQAMVYGNRRERSGTGVAPFDPATGRCWGDYKVRAQGSDIVDAVTTALPLRQHGAREPPASLEALGVGDLLIVRQAREEDIMAGGAIVHVMGSGTIGEVTFYKHSPTLVDRPKVSSLVRRGAMLCADRDKAGADRGMRAIGRRRVRGHVDQDARVTGNDQEGGRWPILRLCRCDPAAPAGAAALPADLGGRP